MGALAGARSAIRAGSRSEVQCAGPSVTWSAILASLPQHRTPQRSDTPSRPAARQPRHPATRRRAIRLLQLGDPRGLHQRLATVVTLADPRAARPGRRAIRPTSRAPRHAPRRPDGPPPRGSKAIRQADAAMQSATRTPHGPERRARERRGPARPGAARPAQRGRSGTARPAQRGRSGTARPAQRGRSGTARSGPERWWTARRGGGRSTPRPPAPGPRPPAPGPRPPAPGMVTSCGR
jgi:hypothetical protein